MSDTGFPIRSDGSSSSLITVGPQLTIVGSRYDSSSSLITIGSSLTTKVWPLVANWFSLNNDPTVDDLSGVV